MSDEELEALRRKKMEQLRRCLQRKPKRETEKNRAQTPRQVLNQFLVGRAWEVLNAAKAQYPQVARHIENTLVRLIMEGRIRNRITGEELYGLFLRLGLKVRLETHIRVLEHGKVKSLEEKIREQTAR